MKQKSFWFDETDDIAISTIQQRYGCESQSQAVRMAVRMLAMADKLNLQLPLVSKYSKTRKQYRSLRGIWAGQIPDTFDIDAALQEIRHEWEEELIDLI